MSELPAEPQAYGKIIEGLIALENGDSRLAIKTLTEANSILDTWLGRFDLGRAYLAAGAFPQADSEFDRCIQRRGEALAVVDEDPTYGFFPIVYYYRGRVREELKTASFADAYREYPQDSWPSRPRTRWWRTSASESGIKSEGESFHSRATTRDPCVRRRLSTC